MGEEAWAYTDKRRNTEAYARGKKGGAAGRKGRHLPKASSCKHITTAAFFDKNKESLLNLVKRKLVQIDRSKSIQKISITGEALVAPRYNAADSIDKVDRSIIATDAWKSRQDSRSTT